jgi:hypothetical protein
MIFKVCPIVGYCFSVEVLDIFYLFSRDITSDFAKKDLLPLEQKLFIMSESIGEALKMVRSPYKFVER